MFGIRGFDGRQFQGEYIGYSRLSIRCWLGTAETTAPGAVSDAAWMVEDSRTCNRGDLGRSAGIVDNKIGKMRLRSEDELLFSVMEEPHARAYGVESLKIRRRESFEIVSHEPRSFWS